MTPRRLTPEQERHQWHVDDKRSIAERIEAEHGEGKHKRRRNLANYPHCPACYSEKQEREQPLALQWIDDPGHAWLRVPLATVQASGVLISAYSYASHGFAYLEEDCDAPAFLAWTDRARQPVDWLRPEDYQTDAPCRSMPRYPR